MIKKQCSMKSIPTQVHFSFNPTVMSIRMSVNHRNMPSAPAIMQDLGLKEPVQVNQQIPLTANMVDWTKRLQRLQAAMPAAEAESIEHLTLEILQNETVKFGKVHQGKTYAEVWSTAEDWVRWFLSEQCELGASQGDPAYQAEDRRGRDPGSREKFPLRCRWMHSRPIPHPDAAGESPWVEQEMGRRFKVAWPISRMPCTRSWSTWRPTCPSTAIFPRSHWPANGRIPGQPRVQGHGSPLGLDSRVSSPKVSAIKNAYASTI